MKRKSGQHLTLLEREKIMLGMGIGKSYRQLDKELGLANGIAGNEVRKNRNQNTGEYLACKAHRKALKRERLQREKSPLKNPEIYLYVKQKLVKEEWPPEIIAGRLKIDKPGLSICPETIYQYIYNKKKHPHQDLRIHLTHAYTKRKKNNGRKVKKSTILDKRMINERPDHINLRQEIGHWETDLVEGLRSDKQAVSVSVERKIKYTKLSLVKNKTAHEKTAATLNQLKFLPHLSITTDNGKENTQHRIWTQELNCPVYFTNPYHSWEKGTVENTNGRLRFFIPKGKSIQNLTSYQLQLIEFKMNSTPRKCLNYLTPQEALNIELKMLK